MSPPIRLYLPRITLKELVILGTPRMVAQCAAEMLKKIVVITEQNFYVIHKVCKSKFNSGN